MPFIKVLQLAFGGSFLLDSEIRASELRTALNEVFSKRKFFLGLFRKSGEPRDVGSQ